MKRAAALAALLAVAGCGTPRPCAPAPSPTAQLKSPHGCYPPECQVTHG